MNPSDRLSLLSISERPGYRSRSAGNRALGWFSSPSYQLVRLSNGKELRVPAGETPLSYCRRNGIDVAGFLTSINLPADYGLHPAS